MMKIKKYEDGNEKALEGLYELWREVAKERPNAYEKDMEQFEKEHLKTFTGEEVQCFMAFEGSDLVSASILELRPKDANPYLNFLVPEERLESEISEELIDRSIQLCREEGKSEVVLSPNIYQQEFIGFLKGHGFEERKEEPTGLWMKKTLEDLAEVQTPPGIDIFAVKELGKKISARELAEVQLDYANTNYNLEKIIEELKKIDREMDDILYGIAKLEDTNEVIGFSRNIFIDLLRGDSIAQNIGLIVKKEHREKGIGGTLLIDSFHRANKKGYDKMYISTHSNNPAQRLYKRAGFEVEREHPHLSYRIKQNEAR